MSIVEEDVPLQDVPVNTSFKVDQDRSTCSNDKCSRRPSYGLLFGKAISCKEHRAKGYIDVVSKRWLSPQQQK